MSGQANPPNWAEIVNAGAALLAFAVAIPAAALLLRDRHHGRRRRLKVFIQGGSPMTRVCQIEVRFTPILQDDRYIAQVELGQRHGAGALYPQQGTVNTHTADAVQRFPLEGPRKIELPLKPDHRDRSLEHTASFCVSGPSLADGITLKVTVSVRDRRERKIRRAITISNAL